MADIYYSPDGNPEIWEEKPAGYLTAGEWKEAHPLPVPDPPTLEEAKAAKLDEIVALRNAKVAESRGEFSGLHFYIDKSSTGDVSKAIQAFREVAILPQIWKAEDGYLPITEVEQLIGIQTACLTKEQELYGVEYALAAQAQAAETVGQVNAIAWPGGE